MAPSTLTDVRDALMRTIGNTIPDLYAYATVSDLEHAPAVVVEPEGAMFDEAFNLGMDDWIFNLYVLCEAGTDSSIGQNRLDDFVSGRGPDSIREAIYTRSDLGLPDVDAHVFQMLGYGGSHDAAKVPLVGAVLRVRVRQQGS